MLSMNLSIVVYRSSCHDRTPIQNRLIHTRKHESGLRKSVWSGVFCRSALFIQVCEIGSACFQSTDKVVHLECQEMSGRLPSLGFGKETSTHDFQGISEHLLLTVFRICQKHPQSFFFLIFQRGVFVSVHPCLNWVDVTHISLFDIRESTAAQFMDKPCGTRHQFRALRPPVDKENG